jgi:hypothetical protein
MRLIESKTLGTAQASIEFTSIPQDGTDLIMMYGLRANNGSNGAGGFWRFNDSTTSIYSFRRLQGDGSSANSYGETNVDKIYGYNFFNSTGSTSNTFNNGVLYIPNYTASINKSMSFDNVHENNGTTAFQTIYAAIWASTAAITKITITPDGGDWQIGSVVSLYKVTKGSDGIVTTSP